MPELGIIFSKELLLYYYTFMNKVLAKSGQNFPVIFNTFMETSHVHNLWPLKEQDFWADLVRGL